MHFHIVIMCSLFLFLLLKLLIFCKYFVSHMKIIAWIVYFGKKTCMLLQNLLQKMHIEIDDWQYLSSSCGIQYLIKLLHLKQMDNLTFSYKSREDRGLCAWHARAIPNDFWGNENIRLSYGTDNLERADLKINLKSLYIICKKLLSISYQHDAAPVCGYCRKFLTAFRDILSQSDLLSGFLNLVP